MVQRWCAWSRLISCMLWLQYWCGSYLTKFQQNLRRMVTLLGINKTRTEQELQQQVKEIHNKNILKTWKQVVTVAFQLTNWIGHTFGMDSIELRPERRPRIVNLAGFALERLGWRRQFREQPQQLQQLHKTKLSVLQYEKQHHRNSSPQGFSGLMPGSSSKGYKHLGISSYVHHFSPSATWGLTCTTQDMQNMWPSKTNCEYVECRVVEIERICMIVVKYASLILRLRCMLD